jgi:hypothetical protein
MRQSQRDAEVVGADAVDRRELYAAVRRVQRVVWT